MEQLVIADLGVPWGDAKQLLKWRKAIDIGQVELASAAGVSHQLISFIETETQTFTESAKSKLWPAILRLGFERAKKGELGNLQAWAQMLLAFSEIEEKKRAEHTERWEKLQAEVAARNRDSLFGGYLFLSWPENEAEMQRIVEEGQASAELSKLILEQVKELRSTPLPREKKAQLAYIRKNPERVLQEFQELFEWREQVLEWYARTKKDVKAEMAAKDARIAELERLLTAKEQSK